MKGWFEGVRVMHGGEVARIRSESFIGWGLDGGSQRNRNPFITRVRTGEAGMIRFRAVRKAYGTHAHVAHELSPATARGISLLTRGTQVHHGIDQNGASSLHLTTNPRPYSPLSREARCGLTCSRPKVPS